MAEELEGDAANLVELAHAETALPTARLEGELRRSAFQLRFFADVVTDGSFVDATIDHASDSPWDRSLIFAVRAIESSPSL